MTVINVGVDFGGTGLRAAYARPGEPARFVALDGPDWPWLLCEPASAGALPVAFPSLKSKLGLVDAVEVDGVTVDPVAALTAALRALRDHLLGPGPATIGQSVISVPARFQIVQRRALLAAADAAGLGTVTLVSDSVAAVMGHTGGEASGTFLVYGMGYSGFELGLVRAVRGRYRTLGYEGASAPGGSTFDEQVLQSWLEALRGQGVVPDQARRGEPGWRALRAQAERAKERLAAAPLADVPMPEVPVPESPADGAAGRPPVHLVAWPFAMLVRFMVAGTLDRADTLFTRSGMKRADVDGVLLVGGSTRMAELRKLITGLGAAVVPTGPEHLARGAVLHAHHLAGRPADSHDERLGLGAQEDGEPPVSAPPLSVTLLGAPGIAPPGDAAEPAGGLDNARRLIRAGRTADAARELRRLVAEAQALLAELDTGTSPSAAGMEPAGDPPATNATHLLSVARRMFDQGHLTQAVAAARAAWEREPERSDLFEAMIDMHCAAAMAGPTVDGFPQDERWLRNALGHDPSSARVRGVLAERIYLHGQQLHRLGRVGEARRALEHALSWDPEHRAARDLLRRLGRSRPGG